MVVSTWKTAGIGRLLCTHHLDPALAVPALGLSTAAAQQPAVTPDLHDHPALLLNVLVRIELRCGHKPAAMRAALERPLDLLDGNSIADRLRAGPISPASACCARQPVPCQCPG